MADAVKWALLAAIIVAVIALIVSLPAFGALDDIFTDGTAVATATAGLSAFTSYLTSARQLINNFVYPPALTIMLTFSLAMWVVYGVIRATTFIVRMIYK